MDTSSPLAILGRTWFAADMADDTRTRLDGLGSPVEYPEGARVVQEGAPCGELGIVVGGRIALRLGLPGGEDRTILTVDDGDVLGWSAVLPPAIATSTAMENVP